MSIYGRELCEGGMKNYWNNFIFGHQTISIPAYFVYS